MKKIFFALIILSLAVTAQEWQSYTSMRNSNGLALDQNGIWVSTNGGIFHYNFSTNEFQKVMKEQGLGSHNTTALNLDENGNVWIGTLEGIINIYNQNAKEVENINEIFNSDKTDKRINSIYTSGDTVLAASNFGISLINANTLAFRETASKLGNFQTDFKVNYVTKIDGRIYACLDAGLAVQKINSNNIAAPESWNSISINSVPGANTISQVLKFNNKITLLTNNGVYQEITNGTWSLLALDDTELRKGMIKNNILYVSSLTNIYKIENSSPVSIYNSGSNQIADFIIGENEEIYVASANSGLIIHTDGNSEFIYPNGPVTNLFSSITVDDNSNVWVGSGTDVSGRGIFRLTQNGWINYTAPNDNIPSNSFHKVFSEGNKVFFANWGFGFTIFENDEFATYNTTNTDLIGVQQNTNFLVIGDVHTDNNGNVWFINSETISRKPLAVLTNNNEIIQFEFNNPRINAGVKLEHLVVDQYDTKWFSVRDEGLYYFNEQNTLSNLNDDFVGRLSSSNGLNSNLITSLAVDNRGELWIGTSQGLNVIYSPNSPTSRAPANIFGLRAQSITAIEVDALNRKWVGTTNGVYLLSSDGLTVIAQYTERNSPLPSNIIKSIAIDDNTGIVYFGTDFGLTSLKTEAVKPKPSFTTIFSYPNPFIIDNNNNLLTIEGLIKDSQIKILSVSGKLVAEFNSPGGNVAFWNGLDSDGKKVSSGVYLIVAYDSEGNEVATGKVAVLRK